MTIRANPDGVRVGSQGQRSEHQRVATSRTVRPPEDAVASDVCDGGLRPVIRVLLVDDDEDEYLLARSLLSDFRDPAFSLEWASTEPDALDKLRAEPFDVGIVDYRLGEGDGVSLIRQATDEGVLVPFVLVTGSGTRVVDEAARVAGAAAFLSKDEMDARTLERTIRYVVTQHSRLDAVTADLEMITAADDAGQVVSVLGPTREAFQAVVDVLVDHRGHGAAAVYIIDGADLRLVAQRGYSWPATTKAARDARELGRETLVREGWVEQAETPQAGPDLVVPLIVDGSSYGVLVVGYDRRGRSPRVVRRTEAIAARLGLAASLYAQVVEITAQRAAANHWTTMDVPNHLGSGSGAEPISFFG
jgi:CheY-like chemotaxis protein